ncbi:MAG: hypothetical protein ACLPXB_19105 [Thiobacillaceae bacterium]
MLNSRSFIRHYPWLPCIWMMLGNAPACASIDATPPQPDIEIIRAEFGLFNHTDSGELAFHPSRVVPFKEGQQYGWSILLRTTQRKIKWREVLTLPSSPTSWEGDLQGAVQRISADRRTSIIEGEVTPVNGVIENVWEVAPGDPVGHYVIEVTINGANQQVFEFEVQGTRGPLPKP